MATDKLCVIDIVLVCLSLTLAADAVSDCEILELLLLVSVTVCSSEIDGDARVFVKVTVRECVKVAESLLERVDESVTEIVSDEGDDSELDSDCDIIS